MIDEKKYRKLKKGIDKIQRHQDEARGAVQQLMETLKTKFKCKTVKSGEKRLKKLKKEEKEHEEKFKKQYKRFKGEYRKLLKAMERNDPEIHRAVPLSLKATGKGKKGNKKAKKRS